MIPRSRRARPKAIAFDIIGTVFDLEAVRPRIEALGLPRAALEGWMAAAIRDAVALAATGDYRSFAEVQRAALDGVLAEQALDPPSPARQAVLDAMANLTPRSDALAALQKVTGAGVGVIALTNGSVEATRELLDRAGLLGLVDHIVSTDEVKLAKPRAEPYWHACERAGLQPHECALVAAHGWDIQGAVAAGLTAAYLNVERPFPATMRRPHAEAATLAGCVDALLAFPSIAQEKSAPNGKRRLGAVAGSLAGGLALTLLLMAKEKKTGRASELADLERAGASKLGQDTPVSGQLPSPREQIGIQGGHLALSALAGLTYAAMTDEDAGVVSSGIAFGLGFYALAHWVVGPGLGIKPPEWRSDPATIGLHAANHIGFGLLTAAAAKAASRA